MNHSPEPFTNIGLSLAEEIIVPAGLWVDVPAPAVAITLVSIFLALFHLALAKVFRLLHVSWSAFVRW